jgi:hypothetical protein
MSYEWVVAAEARKQEDIIKLKVYRRVQEVSLWRFNVWFEDFMCAVAQWYWECVI